MRALLTTISLLLLQLLQAQPGTPFRLLRSYAGPVADALTDNLGNLYLVSNDGQVKKLGPEGDSIAVFNQVRRNGNLHAVDVSNPLKLLLFYKDFAQVVVLDRFLSVQLTLDLRRAGIQQPLAAALSYDNNIWVFDALTGKLKKLDEKGNTLLETPDLRTVFTGGLQPAQIMDQNKWVYLYDPAQGLFVFDYYGNFKRKIPVTGWHNLLITDQQVHGIRDGMLQSYSLSTLMQEQKLLPNELKACSFIRFGWGRIVALCAGNVSVYGTP